MIEKLGTQKQTNTALNGGKNAATYKTLSMDGDVLTIERNKGEETLIYVANLSDKVATIKLQKEGDFKDYFSNMELKLKGEEISLKPWEYKVLIN